MPGQDFPRLVRSPKRSHELKKEPIELQKLLNNAKALTDCTTLIAFWTFNTMGPAAIEAEGQLRWEAHLHSLSPEERQAMAERQASKARE
jgi:hypothetical protein